MDGDRMDSAVSRAIKLPAVMKVALLLTGLLPSLHAQAQIVDVISREVTVLVKQAMDISDVASREVTVQNRPEADLNDVVSREVTTHYLRIAPAIGTVDARQPHLLNDATALLGIGGVDEPVIFDTGEAEFPIGPFAFCEVDEDDLAGPNAIDSVIEDGNGAFAVTLLRPITAGSVSTITTTFYDLPVVAEFVSHPANVNADSAAGAVDVLALIDMINGAVDPPHGNYSTDIDHSGLTTAADVLRVIDLLNGAGAFDVWNATLLPVNPDDCP